MSEWGRRRGERSMWITFRLPLVLSYGVVQNNMLLWRGFEMTVELNAGWETESSVRCLWRRLLCSSTPPSQPLLHNTQRLRLTRTYQVISGQADLSLSSLFPGLFFWIHFSAQLFSPVRYVFSISLSLFFICPHSEAWEVCLEGVMCAESDPCDHQPTGSGHLLAGSNGSIPAQYWQLPLGLSISDSPFSWWSHLGLWDHVFNCCKTLCQTSRIKRLLVEVILIISLWSNWLHQEEVIGKKHYLNGLNNDVFPWRKNHSDEKRFKSGWALESHLRSTPS